MAARTSKNDPALAKLVRERQDLLADWHAEDKRWLLARTQSPNSRIPPPLVGFGERLTAIERRIFDIDHMLARAFPEYNAMQSSEPLAVSEVQDLLGSDEALVLLNFVGD